MNDDRHDPTYPFILLTFFVLALIVILAIKIFQNERAERRVRKRIRELDIPFDSAFMGSWTFCSGWCDHVQAELLPVHRGPDYRTIRKRSTERTILGLTLHVARPEDAPV